MELAQSVAPRMTFIERDTQWAVWPTEAYPGGSDTLTQSAESRYPAFGGFVHLKIPGAEAPSTPRRSSSRSPVRARFGLGRRTLGDRRSCMRWSRCRLPLIGSRRISSRSGSHFQRTRARALMSVDLLRQRLKSHPKDFWSSLPLVKGLLLERLRILVDSEKRSGLHLGAAGLQRPCAAILVLVRPSARGYASAGMRFDRARDLGCPGTEIRGRRISPPVSS